MKRILVTGASGFIAPNLITECLRKKYNVVGVDLLDKDETFPINNKNYKFVKMNVFDIKEDFLRGVDYVFHLAFVTNIPNSIANPVDSTRDNIDMTVHLLNECKKARIKKFLFPSTGSLYGNNTIPWHEEMTPDTIEPYSFQKLSCEIACKTWAKCYDLKTVIFRFFQVYGENQRKDTAISKFIQSKIEGRPITLVETTAQSSFKTGRRDFIYVKDLSEAILIAAESNKTGDGEILNIGSGKATTVEDVAKAVGGEITFIPRRKFEVEAHLADMTKTEKLLGWKYKTEILDWVKKFSISVK
tara:strand:+ start:92 stop:994 length:903 start_codon:yes stop_codon:yes gene_type:complete